MSQKKIMTALGPIAPDELGVTSMHDHLMFNGSVLAKRLRGSLPPHNLPIHEDDKVALDNVGILHRNTILAWDALDHDDEQMVTAEVADFKALGGDSILELSAVGIRMDAAIQKRISEKTGVHVVLSTGFYTGDSWPDEFKGKSLKELYEFMLREVRDGIDGTGIKPGHLKIGLEWMTEDEENALRAAARVANETGLALTIHPCQKLGMNVAHHLKVLKEEGMDLTRVVMAHTKMMLLPTFAEALKQPELYRVDLTGAKSLLDEGCNISVEFMNTMGLELLGEYDAGDWAKMSGYVQLINQGYAGQMVTGNDCCAKIMFRRCGGEGYGRMLYYTKPMLLNAAGLADYPIRQIFEENPKRILAY